LRPRGPHALKLTNLEETLDRFERFCTIDLALSDTTARKHHCREARRFLKWLGDREVTTDVIRDYLALFKDLSASTRAHVIKCLRRFFRDFLGRPDLIASFKLPRSELKPKVIPTREQVQQFYGTLKRPVEKAIFLLFATSGLRKHEVRNLTLNDVDIEKRMIIPKGNESRTKRTWVTLFNAECEQALREYLQRSKLTPESRLFTEKAIRKTFKRGFARTGIHITPQILREWFCCEMGELGVADRYVDAFCGRIPRSILARHYTDFSPERLKRIYDGANLRVLS
jgi:integrase